MISLTLNGEPHPTEADSVFALVAELKLPPETLLIEHNGFALHRSQWTETRLLDGDQIEFLRVAAGG
jgi:thiamine biosynthesis protein ThiS